MEPFDVVANSVTSATGGSVHVLGPAWSDNLVSILENESKVALALRGGAIYSPWATVDLPTVKQLMIHRTIATDADVVERLKEELRLRGINPWEGPDRIAILSEWDTLYGQTLPKLLGAGTSSNVLVARYLRGLDGKAAAAGANKAKEPEEAAEPVERPEGENQLDYARRLASKLKRLEATYGKLSAVGVLGSEVCDKLLLLQALRPQFAGAVFFTTDLDARLFAPNETKWTRNLVVASSFGLELKDTRDPFVRPPIP